MKTPPRLFLSGFLPLLLLLLLSLFLGCDSRDRAIRAALSPDELALFKRGAAIASECWTCHNLHTSLPKIGPGLLGLMGRRAGTGPQFPYSEAMRTSQILWNKDNLAAFLRNGQAFIPGNRMLFAGIGDPGQVRALIFYLEKTTAIMEQDP